MSKQSVIPQSFQHANVYVDHLLALLTGDEHKVFTFALREIMGWRNKISQRKAAISISVFTDGKVVNGQRVSRGTGLSITAVRKALTALKHFNVLVPVGTSAGPNGQEYWLQDDVSAIDWDGLETRFNSRKEAGRKRIEKARHARKRSVTQNGKRSVTQNGSNKKRSVTQNGKRSVTQNGKRSVTQKQRNPIETQEKESLKESIYDKESSSSSTRVRARARARDDDDDDFSSVSNSSFSAAVTEAYAAWKAEPPTPAIANRLAGLVEEYSEAAVVAAIDAAVEHGGKSLKYVSTILKNGESRKGKANAKGSQVSEAELEWARQFNERRRKAVEMSRLRKDGASAGSDVAQPNGVHTA